MYKTVVIDTINQPQNDEYLEHLQKKGKAGFDEWRNYGVEILDLVQFIKQLKSKDGLDCVPVFILGFEGTGKSMGARKLDHESNLWINCDKKPLPFMGWRKLYSPDNKNYTNEKTTYKHIKEYCSMVANQCVGVPPIVFILGHLENYKAGQEDFQRLKVLGKMAHKFNLEGQTVHTYYTQIDGTESLDSLDRYLLRAHNTGFDTARSPEGYFSEETFQNNFQTIVDKIYEDYGVSVG